MNDSEKILLVFDLDHTILNENSDREIKCLFKNYDESIYDADETHIFWGDIMQKVYLKMKEEGIRIEQIKNVIQNLELNKGFPELFEFIRGNRRKFEAIIISGANTLFLKWLFEKHKWDDIFCDSFSNWAEPSEEKLISIRNYHSHDCEICDGSMCKQIILKEFLNKSSTEFSNIVYMGDGGNDFCPSRIMKENDILFPRKDFVLFNKLYKKNKISELKCKVFPWTDGNQIIEKLKENYKL